MENGIVVLNAGDIPGAFQVARDLPSYIVYVFDPVLVDLVAASGLKNIEFIPWADGPRYHELDASARAMAFALEAQLDLALRELIPEVSIRGWQHLNLYYLFMSLKWYAGLWDTLADRLSGLRPHVFICDNPAHYYFNSFVPSVLLLWHLKSRGVEFAAYNYGAREDDADLIPELSGVESAGLVERILTHLPACMYDFRYFDQEVVASGKTLVNIEAKVFNTPLHVHRNIGLVNAEPVVATLPEHRREVLASFSQRLSVLLDAFLEPHIVIPAYRARQSAYIARLYRAQLLTYDQLNSHFQHSRPTRLLLSDHDAGFHGPLVSFAQAHCLPVLLLPHAKTTADIEFSYGNIAALTHPLQGQSIFSAQGKSVLNPHMVYPEKLSASTVFSGGVRTISLLLNAISLNGVPFTSYAEYIAGIGKVATWCRENGIELIVRCKPSYAIVNLLVRELGFDRGSLSQSASESMEEHVKRCDLCLMYDTPTSASLHFLQNAVPIVNCVVEPLSPAELTMVNANLVPQEDVAASLRRLSGFVSDPLNFFTFRNAQFRNYLQLFQNARLLRSYL